MGAVCWDKDCRDLGDQLLSNDIMACVFAGVSLLLRTGGFPNVQMWELPVFLRACSVGLTWSRSGFLVSYTILEQLLLPILSSRKKKITLRIFISEQNKSTAWANDPIPVECVDMPFSC